jgi:hypothetical protein
VPKLLHWWGASKAGGSDTGISSRIVDQLGPATKGEVLPLAWRLQHHIFDPESHLFRDPQSTREAKVKHRPVTDYPAEAHSTKFVLH